MDSRLEKLQQTVSDAIAGMSAEELSWHPPGKWCAAEVLEHLYLTYTGTIKGFRRVLEAGKPLATSATLRQRTRTFVVVGLGYMPQGRKSPPTAQPRGLPAATVQAEIGAKIAEMDEVIGWCEAGLCAEKSRKRAIVDLPILDHPILGPLTARQWCKFHLVHGMHHVKQIRQLRKATRI
jgi:DinB superfamily